MKFVHIPKNGGGTISKWGKKNGYEWGRHDPGIIGLGNEMDQYNCGEHTPPGFDKNFEKYYVDNDTFCVKRNPYDHLLSAYYWRNKEKTPCEKHSDYLNNTIKEKVQEYERGNVKEWNCMNVPQTKYIYNTPGGRVCDNVMDISEINEKVPKLLGRNDKITEDSFFHIESNDKRCKKEDLYPSTIELINKVYEKDFNKLGYKML